MFRQLPNNMEVARQVLEKTAKVAEKYKPVAVNKEVNIDAGCLLVEDLNPVATKALKDSFEDYLRQLARENTQALFNNIWDLPTERVDEAIVAKLPKQRFLLPRFKPVPKPRPLTKWQQFAKDKGIDKKKKDKLTWDEELNKWIPRYGYKRSEADRDKNWLIEVPDNADPLEDQFAKRGEVKSEKVAKNELQRLRNIAKARKVKVPRFGLTDPEQSSARELKTAVTVAKASTASLGKFQDKLPGEKEAKGVAAITPGASRKRKLPPPVSGIAEKQRSMDLVEEVLRPKSKVINIEKAVARQINDEQTETGGKVQKKGRGGDRRGGNKRKPKGHKAVRKGKAPGGRKRR